MVFERPFVVHTDEGSSGSSPKKYQSPSGPTFAHRIEKVQGVVKDVAAKAKPCTGRYAEAPSIGWSCSSPGPKSCYVANQLLILVK